MHVQLYLIYTYLQTIVASDTLEPQGYNLLNFSQPTLSLYNIDYSNLKQDTNQLNLTHL